MSTAIPPRPRFVTGKRSFVIVASQFNPAYVQGLVDHAAAELRRLVPSAKILFHQVPGAFEIPIVVREVASQKNADAIIAIGVILKGETDHAEHLGRAVTDGLQRIALEYGIPVLNCVLSLNHEMQARERCLGEQLNRGTEVARAAVAIFSVLNDLRA
jgi:6,7-dimethyl-8-ribityllumazine synthase